MAITQDRTDDSAPEGASAAPDGEHGVLHDLLSEHALACYQQNLDEHDLAVLAVERGHRADRSCAAAGRHRSHHPHWR
jgi:hypothetical protein